VPNALGDWLIFAGIALLGVGVVAKFGLLGWFGNLPGDIRIKSENGAFYFPIVTMIVVSVVLSVVINLLRRF
jgi:hypothetical protein